MSKRGIVTARKSTEMQRGSDGHGKSNGVESAKKLRDKVKEGAHGAPRSSGENASVNHNWKDRQMEQPIACASIAVQPLQTSQFPRPSTSSASMPAVVPYHLPRYSLHRNVDKRSFDPLHRHCKLCNATTLP